MSRTPLTAASVLGAAAVAALALTATPSLAAPAPAAGPQPTAARAHAYGSHPVRFDMVRSAGVERAGCLPNAKARVEITPGEEAETMKVWVSGLPANTEFDFFVLQVPDAPFGLAWYQGDLDTDTHGRGYATYRGRFNDETFSLAVGAPVPAPTPHAGDASSNPVTRPVHQYHLGFWFNSPEDADKAGCGALVTPFNGEHDAGTQAMSTRNFPAEAGPLARVSS